MQFVISILIDFWNTLSAMAPYLLFGFLVAGFLSVWISPAMVQRHLGGRGFKQIFKATIFGIPLPLCSCSVIPVASSLRRHGAGQGATASFLLATPQANVESVLVTYSLLGPIMAIFRPISALFTGLLGGGLVEFVARNDALPKPVDSTEESCCQKDKPRKNGFVRAIHHAYITLPTDIGRAMLVGLAVAALIATFVPDDFFSSYLAGGGGIVAMLVMLAAGIPVYVCATSSVPMAVAMMAKGLSPGAAMVFLMTGPATNAAALAMLWATLGRRSAIAYLASVVISALVAGLIIDRFIFVGGFDPDQHFHAAMLPGWLENIAAIVLLGVLALGWYRKSAAAKPRDSHAV